MPARKVDIAIRLASGWVCSGNGCHIWTKKVTRGGYGVISEHSKNLLAHRVAYTLAKGPIGPGLEVDHLCRNPSCVNPEHLEAVTKAENMRRTSSFTKGACKNGHLFDEQNTLRVGEKRICRACARSRSFSYYWGGAAVLDDLIGELERERAARLKAEAEVNRLNKLIAAFGAQHGVVFHDQREAA